MKFSELSKEEQINSLDRMLNVLTHNDWSELYLMFSEAMNIFREQMETAVTWEEFITSRAHYLYIKDSILTLPDRIRAEKAELEETTNEYED